MARRTRAGVLTLAGTMSLLVGVVGLSWACGPSGYGVPETPAAPPSSTAQPQAPSAAPAPSANATPPSPAVRVEVGSGSVNSVADQPRARGVQPQRAPVQQGGSVGVRNAPAPATPADINARIGGSTAGVVRQGGQSVFASSAAPGSAKAKAGKSAAARKKAAKSTSAPALSQRSATADLWSGLNSKGANLASAASAGGTSGGLSTGVVAALAMLGVGLAGLTGAALLTGRRRRAGAAAGAPKNQ